jgi:YfiH family protein
MIDKKHFKTSEEGVLYLDLQEFLGTPSGVILRNDLLEEEGLIKFIAGHCRMATGRKTLKVVRVNQKHTNRVVDATDNTGRPADGLYTNSSDNILVIKTADCLPLFLNDRKTVGLLHLGWRGIFLDILKNFIATVPGFKANDAVALLGPAIGSCCFEVSIEVALLFDKKYRIRRGKSFYIDLEGLVVDELASYGVNSIVKSGACTYCHPDLFYSYRREGTDVRELYSFICLGG